MADLRWLSRTDSNPRPQACRARGSYYTNNNLELCDVRERARDRAQWIALGAGENGRERRSLARVFEPTPAALRSLCAAMLTKRSASCPKTAGAGLTALRALGPEWYGALSCRFALSVSGRTPLRGRPDDLLGLHSAFPLRQPRTRPCGPQRHLLACRRTRGPAMEVGLGRHSTSDITPDCRSGRAISSTNRRNSGGLSSRGLGLGTCSLHPSMELSTAPGKLHNSAPAVHGMH